MSARPREAQEMDGVTGAVDDFSALLRDECLPGPPPGPRRGRVPQCFDAAVCGDGVRVEEEQQFAGRLLDTTYAAAAEPEVCTSLDDAGPPRLTTDFVGGAIGRRVVDGDDLVAVAKLALRSEEHTSELQSP